MKLFQASATALLLALFCALSAYGATAVRFIHAASATPPVTVRFDALPLFLNRAPMSASSVRSELPPLSYQVQIRDTNTSNPPLRHSTDMAVTDGLSQSLVFAGTPGSYESLVLSWDRSIPQLGNILIRFVHVAPSVEERITVLVGGSLFFQPLDAMSATNFIEIPLAQASNFTYVLTSSNAELAKYTAAGRFEAGNVYTVYFVDGESDREARVVNETSVDEQAPMASLQRAGTQLTLRTVNTVSTGIQAWSVNGLPLFSSVAPFSASQTATAFADGSALIAVHPAANPATTLAERTLDPGPNNQFTLVSYGISSAIQLMELSTAASLPAAGSALVRLAHTAPGVVDVEIARDSDPLIGATAYGTASSFVSLQAQQQTLRVRRADTKAVIAEFSLAPVSAHIYTLFLAAGGSGPEVRLLDESNTSPQAPLPVLNIQPAGEATLRAVNLIAGKSVRISTDQSMVVDRLDYRHADALATNFTAGTYLFSAGDADAPDVPLASIGGQIADKGNYLVVFLGSPAKAQGVIVGNTAVKQPKDSVLVRFMNAAEDIDNLRVVDQASGAVLADKLSYSGLSGYKPFPKGDRTYRLFEGTSQEIAVLNDTYTAHEKLTVFIVREDDRLMGYILPDEAPEGFRPMPGFEAVVGVGEPGEAPSPISAPWPNPARDNAAFRLALAAASEVGVRIVDISGRTVQATAPVRYPAGTHTIAVDCGSLPEGLYMATVQVDGRLYSYTLAVIR